MAGIMETHQRRLVSATLDELGLTRREADIVGLLVEGDRIEQLADRLDIRPATVRTHLRSIFSKLGVTRQPQLVTLVLKKVLARLEHSLFSLEVNATRTPLPEIYSDLIARGNRLAESRGVQFDYWIAPDLPKHISTDAAVLSRVLGFLTELCINLTIDDTVHLVIRATRDDKAPCTVHFELTGNAIRALESELGRSLSILNSPATPPLDSSGPDVGWKLVMCQCLVAQLGGFLSLRTQVAESASIRVVLTTAAASARARSASS